jgi:hypothetical protein
MEYISGQIVGGQHFSEGINYTQIRLPRSLRSPHLAEHDDPLYKMWSPAFAGHRLSEGNWWQIAIT